MIEYILCGIGLWVSSGYLLFAWSYKWELVTYEEIMLGLMVMWGGPLNIFPALKVRKLTKIIDEL